MLRYRLFLVMLLFTTLSRSASFVSCGDSLKVRKIIAGSGIGLSWAGSMGALWHVWYSKTDRSPFHFFNDGKVWMQMDKAGHLYSAYELTNFTNDILTWSGVASRQSVLLASGIAIGYQTTLEIFDGTSKKWGFSMYDFGFNIAGAALFTSQELLLHEQWILPKFSYAPSPYAQLRPEVLGSSFGERLLKDYNGQTYWLSMNPFLRSTKSLFPSWLCFSLGYSVDAKLRGDTDTYTHSDGTNYISRREWFFSMDLDFSRIPVKKPFWKKVMKQLNYLKLPFPALKLSGGKLTAIPIYF